MHWYLVGSLQASGAKLDHIFPCHVTLKLIQAIDKEGNSGEKVVMLMYKVIKSLVHNPHKNEQWKKKGPPAVAVEHTLIYGI